MKHNKLFILPFILMAAAGVKAQSPQQGVKRNLQLPEAISLSIKNSHQLQADRAKIMEASAALQESIEQKLPNVSTMASYLRLNNANVDLKTSNTNNGGTNTNGTPKISQAFYGLLNASIPIYAGGRIKYGIESSRYLEEASKLDAAYDSEAIIQTTIEAFANLFKANSAVILVRENLVQSKKRAADFSNLEKNGLMAANDRLKAQLQASNVELSLVDAENNWQLANLNMDLMLGLPTETILQLDTTGIARKEDDRVLADYLQMALTNRKDATALALRKKAAATGVKAVNAEKYPSVQFSVGYIAADIPNLLTVTNAVNAGVGVSYNLSSLWKTKSKVQQAEAKVQQLEANEAMVNDIIIRQVSSSYLTLISNRKKIEVYVIAQEQAQENYRITKNKFDNSLATATDLLEADVALLQAKLSYTLARADAFVAYHKLLQASGLLTASTAN